MTPKRWRRIETLFEAVLDRPREERAAFLDRACEGDPALRKEVDSLRRVYEEEPAFLEVPLVEAPILPEAAEGGDVEEGGDRHIGPYRLIRPLGRGGMGQVFLAVRDDESFTQYVALKVIRRGLDTEDFLRRFRAERQILARLGHPGIARLLDGGASEAGRSYFVMEYVEGEPITAYCDRRRLSVNERLRLFRKVCDAVHHAHRNLVVHRDLKPSNILVTEEGQPKLLDFGIAKLLNPERTSVSAPTQTGRRVMTPAYASPEQLREGDVTTDSDVYALGVLLYQLLTGRRPYRLEGRSPREVERIICENEPERPSVMIGRTDEIEREDGDTTPLTPADVSAARSTRTEHLRHRLQGDLDTIVLKALRKEPERRYASAAQISEDVRLHLDGLPVVARPDTLAYRMKKFVRRHRVGVAASTAIALLLAAAAVVTAVQSHRIRAKAEEVRTERDRSEQVVDFLVDLFEASDPNEAPGDTLTAPELLARGAERVEDELTDQPAVQAEMMQVMSRVYERRGRYEQGERMARRALQLTRRLHGERSRESATALNSVGWLLHQQSEYSAADSALQVTLARRRALLGPRHLDVARTLNDLAVVRQARGDYRSADTLLQRALSIRREQHGDQHQSVATTLNNVAALKWRLGDYETAERQLRDVLSILRTEYGDEHTRVAIATSNLAALLLTKGDAESAEPLDPEALAVRRTLLGGEHPDVARSLVHLGNLYRSQQRFDKAVPLFREALVIQRKQLGTEHEEVADTQRLLARLHRQREDYERAAQRYREALTGFRAVLPEGHEKTAQALLGLGRVYLSRNEPNRAEPVLRKALAMQRRNFGFDHRLTVEAQTTLGICLTDLRRYAEAESLLTGSHQILQKLQGANTDLTRRTIRSLVALYETWGRPAQAKSYQTGS